MSQVTSMQEAHHRVAAELENGQGPVALSIQKNPEQCYFYYALG
jgi:hypothetical protein